MIIECDVDKLGEVGLNPTIFCYLYYTYKGLHYPFENSIPGKIINEIRESGWISIDPNGIVSVKPKFKEFIAEREDTKNVNSWIKEYCDLWPQGVLNGATPVKSAPGNCAKKMITFINQNKKITKNDILEATAIYVERKKNEKYKFMTSSQNFIYKDGDSLLLTFVEDSKARELYRQTKLDSEEGGSAFHKQI